MCYTRTEDLPKPLMPPCWLRTRATLIPILQNFVTVLYDFISSSSTSHPTTGSELQQKHSPTKCLRAYLPNLLGKTRVTRTCPRRPQHPNRELSSDSQSR